MTGVTQPIRPDCAVQFDPVGQQADERGGGPEGDAGTAAEQQGPHRTRCPQRDQGEDPQGADDRRGEHGQGAPGQDRCRGGDLHLGEQRGQAGHDEGRGGELAQTRAAAGDQGPDRQREQDRGHADRLDDRERRPRQRQHVQHLTDPHDREPGQPDRAPQHLPQQPGVNDTLSRRRAGFLLLQGGADGVAQGREQGRGHPAAYAVEIPMPLTLLAGGRRHMPARPPIIWGDNPTSRQCQHEPRRAV